MNQSSVSSSPTAGFRKGKWTPEEEAYLMAIVRYFNAGLLNIPQGKSLRSLLSEKLNCDPMRITKKYSGSSAVGKQTFVPCVLTDENIALKAECEEVLSDLQQRFYQALNAPSPLERSDSYTLIADGTGSWVVDEHTFHFSKKSKIHKSASAPALNRLGDIGEGNMYIDRNSMTSVNAEPRTRSNSLKAYTMDDAAAGNLLLDFFESVRSGIAELTESASGAVTAAMESASRPVVEGHKVTPVETPLVSSVLCGTQATDGVFASTSTEDTNTVAATGLVEETVVKSFAENEKSAERPRDISTTKAS